MALDETTETTQNSPQETAQASEGQPGTTPETPETFTQKQVDKVIRDTRAAAGRELAANARKEADDLRGQLAQVQREKDEAELEAARGDPQALSVIQRERKIRADKADIEKRESHIKPLEERATEFERKELAQEVATQYGVEASLLMEHTDGSREKMEGLAEVLAQSIPSPKVREDLKPDSAISAGGGTMPESAKEKIRAGWDEIHKT